MKLPVPATRSRSYCRDWERLPARIVALVCVLLFVVQLRSSMWFQFSRFLASNGGTESLDLLEASVPRIVLWTKFYDGYDYSGAGVESGMWSDCSGPCEIVYVNKTEDLRSNDAIIFHVRNLEWEKLPKRRHPDQIWIFFILESPEHSGGTAAHLELYGHIFNWTMTYRRDSDVYYPYGVVRKRATESDEQEEDARLNAALANKTRLAAIAVTHCNTPSNRESLIQTLQHHASANSSTVGGVDVFGRCSANATCGTDDGINACQTMACKFAQFSVCYAALTRSHKFYFAFENSLCVDYATEKFFMALQHDIVPVVYGGLAVPYAEVAPPASYINARDYAKPEDLLRYLQHLDKNPEEYLKYFRWKGQYDVSVSQAVGWCTLCERLRRRQCEPDAFKRQSYSDIRTWWNSAPMEGGGAMTTKMKPACELKPHYELKGWADPKFNRMYRR